MSKRISFLILLFIVNYTTAQEVSAFTVYFDKDEYFLTDKAKETLGNLSDSLKPLEIISINLAGHTDSDASNDYNLTLSQNRVEEVRKYLINHSFSPDLMKSDFQGESHPIAANSTENGMAKNRRVEIQVVYRLPEIRLEVKKEKDCSVDTLIRLQKGTLVKVNKCFYEENPDCIQIKEIINQADAASANVETVDTENNLLVSGGMFDYAICDGVEVTFYAEASFTCFSGSMDLWTLDASGRWTRMSDSPLETVEINGIPYYPINITGIGMCNLDQVAPRTRLNKIKFKAKKGIELDTISLSCDCAFWRVNSLAKDKEKRKVKFKVLCCDDTQVDISARAGEDTLIFEMKSLSAMEEKSKRGYCAGDGFRIFRPFRKRYRSQYRKYKVKRSDFESGTLN